MRHIGKHETLHFQVSSLLFLTNEVSHVEEGAEHCWGSHPVYDLRLELCTFTIVIPYLKLNLLVCLFKFVFIIMAIPSLFEELEEVAGVRYFRARVFVLILLLYYSHSDKIKVLRRHFRESLVNNRFFVISNDHNSFTDLIYHRFHRTFHLNQLVLGHESAQMSFIEED